MEPRNGMSPILRRPRAATGERQASLVLPSPGWPAPLSSPEKAPGFAVTSIESCAYAMVMVSPKLASFGAFSPISPIPLVSSPYCSTPSRSITMSHLPAPETCCIAGRVFGRRGMDSAHTQPHTPIIPTLCKLSNHAARKLDVGHWLDGGRKISPKMSLRR